MPENSHGHTQNQHCRFCPYSVGCQGPLSIVGTALAVGLVSVMPSLPPGQGATRVDPIDALRAE